MISVLEILSLISTFPIVFVLSIYLISISHFMLSSIVEGFFQGKGKALMNLIKPIANN